MRTHLSLLASLHPLRAPLAALALLAAAPSLVACAGDDTDPPVPDSGTSVDASKAGDGSVGASDSATPTEAATPTDSAARSDAPTETDSATATDAGGETG